MCHGDMTGRHKEATINATKAVFDSGRMNNPKACYARKEKQCVGKLKG
jgi:hypothetical protein